MIVVLAVVVVVVVVVAVVVVAVVVVVTTAADLYCSRLQRTERSVFKYAHNSVPCYMVMS